jgi:hypothetical protein
MTKKKTAPVYGYYSHNHASIPGCEIRVYLNSQGREVLVTGFGSTQNPKDSGYYYLQTIEVGKITNQWELIDCYIFTKEIDPPYLLDPEDDLEAA